MLEDCLQNILHDIVIEVHREEKIARAHSAIILAEQEQERQNDNTVGPPSSENRATGETRRSVETAGAKIENGKASLKGNPLETTKETICRRCRLPRLLHPMLGKGAVAPEPGKKFCSRRLPIEKAGYDIWGHSLASNGVNTAKPKKDKKEMDKGNAESGSATPPGANVPKGAVTFPSVKCPHCPRYLVVTRLAPHLEKCMGISGRNASRNAMAKMDSSQGRNSSTPHGSRLGTPLPSVKKSPGKRRHDSDDDEESDDAPKKKKKKPVKKAGDKAQPAKPKKAKEANVAGKTVLGQSQARVEEDRPSNSKKRGREDEGDEGTPNGKKAKLQESSKPAKPGQASSAKASSGGVQKPGASNSQSGPDGEKTDGAAGNSATKNNASNEEAGANDNRDSLFEEEAFDSDKLDEEDRHFLAGIRRERARKEQASRMASAVEV